PSCLPSESSSGIAYQYDDATAPDSSPGRCGRGVAKTTEGAHLLVGQPLVGDVDSVARRADISLAIPPARTRPKQWRAATEHHRREVYTELVHDAPLERMYDDVADAHDHDIALSRGGPLLVD